MAKNDGDVSLTVDAAIARLTIKSGRLNILSNYVRGRIAKAIESVKARTDAAILIIEGEGDIAFSVGSDLTEFPTDAAGAAAKIQFEQDMLDAIEALPQIVISKLRGHVLGGGAELMLATDLRIASADCKIGFPEIKVGVLPAAGGMRRLVRDIGLVNAKAMVLFGGSIDAKEARAMGLIQRVVANEALEEATMNIAALLATLPHNSLSLAKRCMNSDPARMAEVEREVFAELFEAGNVAEGRKAFLEKRVPVFNQWGRSRVAG